MEMRIFAYNSNVLLVMATLTLDRNEAINLLRLSKTFK